MCRPTGLIGRYIFLWFFFYIYVFYIFICQVFFFHFFFYMSMLKFNCGNSNIRVQLKRTISHRRKTLPAMFDVLCRDTVGDRWGYCEPERGVMSPLVPSGLLKDCKMKSAQSASKSSAFNFFFSVGLLQLRIQNS